MLVLSILSDLKLLINNNGDIKKLNQNEDLEFFANPVIRSWKSFYIHFSLFMTLLFLFEFTTETGSFVVLVSLPLILCSWIYVTDFSVKNQNYRRVVAYLVVLILSITYYSYEYSRYLAEQEVNLAFTFIVTLFISVFTITETLVSNSLPLFEEHNVKNKIKILLKINKQN